MSGVTHGLAEPAANRPEQVGRGGEIADPHPLRRFHQPGGELSPTALAEGVDLDIVEPAEEALQHLRVELLADELPQALPRPRSR